MFRTSKPICLFTLVLFGLVLLAGVPAGAQNSAKISKVKITDEQTEGYIETEIDGNTPVDSPDPPCYSEKNDGDCNDSFTRATDVWVCRGNPRPSPSDEFDDANCRKVVSTTFGAAWNTWVLWGGLWWWIAP